MTNAKTKTSRIAAIILALMVALTFSFGMSDQASAASGPKAPAKVHYKKGKTNGMPVVNLTWSKVKGAKGYQVKYRVREYYYISSKTPVPQKWTKWKSKRVAKKTILKHVLGRGSASTDAKIQVKLRSYKIKNGKRVYGKWRLFKKKYIKGAYKWE